MTYQVECDLDQFEAWSGGNDTLETLKERGDCDSVQQLIEEHISCSGEPWTATAINDFLWFERDFIAQHLGYSDWEDYEYGDHEKDDEDEDEEDDEDNEDDDNEDGEDLNENGDKRVVSDIFGLPLGYFAKLKDKAKIFSESVTEYLKKTPYNWVVWNNLLQTAVYWDTDFFDWVVYGDKEECQMNCYGCDDEVITEREFLERKGLRVDELIESGLYK